MTITLGSLVESTLFLLLNNISCTGNKKCNACCWFVSVTGLNVWISVFSIGVVCTFYTTLVSECLSAKKLLKFCKFTKLTETSQNSDDVVKGVGILPVLFKREITLGQYFIG